MELFRRINHLSYVFPSMFSNLFVRRYCVKHSHPSDIVIKEETIKKIEQLSLIEFSDKRHASVLRAAIAFTERLRTSKIDETIEPLYSPFEEQLIPLRDDCVNDKTSRSEILMNATVLEEEYFVGPLNTIKK